MTKLEKYKKQLQKLTNQYDSLCYKSDAIEAEIWKVDSKRIKLEIKIENLEESDET